MPTQKILQYHCEQGTAYRPVHRHEFSILHPVISLSNADSEAKRHTSAHNRPVYRNAMRRTVCILRHGQIWDTKCKVVPLLNSTHATKEYGISR